MVIHYPNMKITGVGTTSLTPAANANAVPGQPAIASQGQGCPHLPRLALMLHAVCLLAATYGGKTEIAGSEYGSDAKASYNRERGGRPILVHSEVARSDPLGVRGVVVHAGELVV